MLEYDTYTIAATAVVGLLLIAALVVFFSGGGLGGGITNKKPTFIITGPAFSGKTCLFLKWSKNKDKPATVTSSTPNTFEQLRVPFGSEKIETEYTIVDMPGNPKLRYMTRQKIDECRDNLMGVIFMVDASNVTNDIKNIAFELYELLQQVEKRSSGTSIIIAANKSELFNAMPVSRVHAQLEKEINQLRSTKSRSVGDSGADDADEDAWVGLDGEFKFDQLRSNVAVIDGSVVGNRTHKWEEWVVTEAANPGA